jgi:hypothetical protein
VGIEARQRDSHRRRRREAAKGYLKVPTVKDIKAAKLHRFKDYATKFIEDDFNAKAQKAKDTKKVGKPRPQD